MGQLIYRDTQHAFDAVAKYLRRPGAERCMNNDGYCMYYVDTPDGYNRCGIGGIMTVAQAKMYRDANTGIDTLLSPRNTTSSEGVKERFKNCDPFILRELQRVHDEGAHWSKEGFNYRGELALKNLAKEHDLKYTPK